MKKVRNAFNINQAAQDAALVSIGDDVEVARRRAETAVARAGLVEACAALPVRVGSPPVANFVFVDVGGDAGTLFQALLHEGVIVRPLAPFGAPEAVRVTVGTAEENEVFARAFARCLAVAGNAS